MFTTFFRGRFLWFLLPGAILTLAYLSTLYFNPVENYIIDVGDGNTWDQTIISWFNSVTTWIHSLFTYILDKVYIFLILTLLSPFHAFIAERFDQSLTGNKFPYSFKHFLQDFFRMLVVVFIALIMELSFMLVWWLLSFIPGLALFDELMYFLISAFFFGFAFHDYALERYRLSIGKSILFAFNHPLTMLLTGTIFLSIYAIPYAGIPLTGVITTMISTVVYLRIHGYIDA